MFDEWYPDYVRHMKTIMSDSDFAYNFGNVIFDVAEKNTQSNELIQDFRGRRAQSAPQVSYIDNEERKHITHVRKGDGVLI